MCFLSSSYSRIWSITRSLLSFICQLATPWYIQRNTYPDCYLQITLVHVSPRIDTILYITRHQCLFPCLRHAGNLRVLILNTLPAPRAARSSLIMTPRVIRPASSELHYWYSSFLVIPLLFHCFSSSPAWKSNQASTLISFASAILLLAARFVSPSFVAV